MLNSNFFNFSVFMFLLFLNMPDLFIEIKKIDKKTYYYLIVHYQFINF